MAPSSVKPRSAESADQARRRVGELGGLGQLARGTARQQRPRRFAVGFSPSIANLAVIRDSREWAYSSSFLRLELLTLSDTERYRATVSDERDGLLQRATQQAKYVD